MTLHSLKFHNNFINLLWVEIIYVITMRCAWKVGGCNQYSTEENVMRSWHMIVEALEIIVNVVNHIRSIFDYGIEYMKSFLWVDRIYGVFVVPKTILIKMILGPLIWTRLGLRGSWLFANIWQETVMIEAVTTWEYSSFACCTCNSISNDIIDLHLVIAGIIKWC